MAEKITKSIIKDVVGKIKDMSKDDCISFLKTYKIDIGFEKSDYEEITEDDLRDVVVEELELILEDFEDDETTDDDEVEDKKEEKIVKATKENDKKEIAKKKTTKNKTKGQSEPTQKLKDGRAYILLKDDGAKLYPTLESKSTNFPILDSDVEVEININDNVFKAFDDGKYISFQVNGRWCAILNKYMPIDASYTVVEDGISDSIADYIEDLLNCNQSESDWTPKNIKSQPVKRPKKVIKEGKPVKKVEEVKAEEPKEVEPVEKKEVEVKEPKKDKIESKDKKDKKDKKSKKDKKNSKKTKTTKTSKK